MRVALLLPRVLKLIGYVQQKKLFYNCCKIFQYNWFLLSALYNSKHTYKPMVAFSRIFILQLLEVFFVLIRLYFQIWKNDPISADNHKTVAKLLFCWTQPIILNNFTLIAKLFLCWTRENFPRRTRIAWQMPLESWQTRDSVHGAGSRT